MYVTHLPSPFGEITLAWEAVDTDPIVRRVFLSCGVDSSRQRALVSYPAAQAHHHPTIDSLAEQLQSILGGEDHTIDLAVVGLDTCPAFQRRVLLAEYAIPRGSVATYGQLAAYLGVRGGARAVGNALAGNPFPLVIPCHRAIRSDGTLGGYQGGLAMKRALLAYEGHAISPTGRLLNPRFHY